MKFFLKVSLEHFNDFNEIFTQQNFIKFSISRLTTRHRGFTRGTPDVIH